jgi:ABC-type nickel/cobalt efflux system permease component RcnA
VARPLLLFVAVGGGLVWNVEIGQNKQSIASHNTNKKKATQKKENGANPRSSRVGGKKQNNKKWKLHAHTQTHRHTDTQTHTHTHTGADSVRTERQSTNIITKGSCQLRTTNPNCTGLLLLVVGCGTVQALICKYKTTVHS